MSSSPSSRPRKSAGPTARCSACGSRMRAAETWCSLCHHSVQTPTSPEVAPAGPETSSPGSFTKSEPTFEPTTDPAVVARADRLIAELAAAEADRGRESGLGTLQTKLGARGGGLVLAVSGGVVLLVIGILSLTLLGLLL